jgi:hypothetical protein
MYASGGLRIELHRGNKRNVFDVHYDRALIGSGAHCDVRLAPDEAAIEHLVVQLVGDDEVFAESKAVEPMCLLNGAPFLEGRLLPTSMLELGGVALRVLRTEKEEQAGARKKGSGNSTTSPAVQALGLFVVAVGLWWVLADPEPMDNGMAASMEPPPPAASQVEPCAEHDARSATAMATQLQLEAESRRERSPFSASAAPEAVVLFERAAGCFQAAALADLARDARSAAELLRNDIREQIHIRHVRLARYLTLHEYAEARHQATLLADLVGDKTGPYARWLSSVRREGELHAKQKAK